ncbi:hypothetical protein J4Q44_G00044160 [Coregonus suidteri]|uniref:Uncharacterized protein n=1 Tax=Coregonus suidteri TaxID=861788 RepID=A0AAN8M938_9TELE
MMLFERNFLSLERSKVYGSLRTNRRKNRRGSPMLNLRSLRKHAPPWRTCMENAC